MQAMRMDIVILMALLSEQIQWLCGLQEPVSVSRNGYSAQVYLLLTFLITAKKIAIDTNSTVLLANVSYLPLIEANIRHGIIEQMR